MPLDSALQVGLLGIPAQQRLMAAATIRDLLRLRDTRCRSIAIVHAGEFTLSLSIEGVCSELVQTLCFRFSRGRVARVSTGHFTDIRVMRCLVKTCLLAP